MDQMNTRSVYTRTACYERGQLYTVVDRDAPCFYPFGVNMNAEADELYLRAAYTGAAQTGVLRDKNGERLVCVTPVGGMSGSTVYLLETGILMDNVRAYTRAYLLWFCALGVVFLAAVSAVLAVVFRRVLRPLSQIRAGLEQFAQGDRTVRLEDADSDEFSGIVRVFNKMAGRHRRADLQPAPDQRHLLPVHSRRRCSSCWARRTWATWTWPAASGRRTTSSAWSLQLPAKTADPGPRPRSARTGSSPLWTSCARSTAPCCLTDSVNLRRLQVICPAGGDQRGGHRAVGAVAAGRA